MSVQTALLILFYLHPKHLNSKNHRIKSKCIALLTLCFSKPAFSADIEKIIKILLEFLSDQDPRVRHSAVDSLVSVWAQLTILASDQS